MKDIRCKVLVIGAGPGGYVAAIRAGQLGLDTVIVEVDRMGGTCLNVGCIPSKAFIHAAEAFERTVQFAADHPLGISVADPRIDLARTVAWKDGIVNRLNNGVSGLLRKAGVKTVAGWARFLDGKTVEVETATQPQVIRAEHVILATGSAPVSLPALPFGGRVMSSTEALSLSQPPANLVVVGAGYIGLELGTALLKLGSRVTVIEAQQRILPQYDAELSRPVARRLHELGAVVMTGARAQRLSSREDALLVTDSGGKELRLPADKVLVTVGRKPVIERWGLEELDLDMEDGCVAIDDHCRTSMRGVWAVGDVTGEPMLAHRAMAQGELVAENIAGHKRPWDRLCIPSVCFTDPEVVSAGLSADEARAQGIEVRTGLFPFKANGRAMTTEREDGFVRVVARADNHLLLGLQAVGANVSELAANMGLALEMGARLEDVAATIHAHPTRSEGLLEAALNALGHGLHA